MDLSMLFVFHLRIRQRALLFVDWGQAFLLLLLFMNGSVKENVYSICCLRLWEFSYAVLQEYTNIIFQPENARPKEQGLLVHQSIFTGERRKTPCIVDAFSDGHKLLSCRLDTGLFTLKGCSHSRAFSVPGVF